MLANAIGNCPALANNGILEHCEPARKRLVDPVAMSCNRTDCFICRVGETLAYIIGLITYRCNRMLCCGVKILAQQARIFSKDRDGAARGGRKMLAQLICPFIYRRGCFLSYRSQALMQGFRAVCDVIGRLPRYLFQPLTHLLRIAA